MNWRIGMFDWDGVLFDSVEINYQATTTIFTEFGLLIPSKEEWEREMTADYPKFYYDRGISRSVLPQELSAIRQAYLEQHWNDAHLNRGAIDILLACTRKNITVAIVTSETEENIRRRIDDFHIGEYIDHVHPGAMDRAAALEKTLRKFGLQSQEAFYVDDTASGLVKARGLGIATIGFSGGFNPHDKIREAQPDYPKDDQPITSLYQVTSIIMENKE